MGYSEVKVTIDKSKTGGTFTNYDIIKGVVRLTTNTEITLSFIQVKLEGISKSIVNVPQTTSSGKSRKDKILVDMHKLLYDTVIVFPPPNVRTVANSKEFTLTPGNYDYPFEFKLPLNNACTKIQGVSNRLQLINNSMEFISNHSTNHIRTQLPPSLSGIDSFANVKYFVKVTAKRSSLIKPNLRYIDPFIFLPLDLNINNDDSRQAFIRKEMIFKDKLPEIVAVSVPEEAPGESKPRQKQLPDQNNHQRSPRIQQKKSGFFSKLFGEEQELSGPPAKQRSPQHTKRPSRSAQLFNRPKVKSMDIGFYVEVRFRYPAYLIPTKLPNYKIFLLTKKMPSIFTLHNIGSDESSGLGAIYLQKINIELFIVTNIISQGNKSSVTHKELICDNNFNNVKFDLRDSIKSKLIDKSTNLPLYELEIPSKLFSNAVLPDYLSPSFKTCNITRKYKLQLNFGFSPEKLSQSERPRETKYISLETDVKVLSGLSMTPQLEQNLGLYPPNMRHDSTVSESESPTSSITQNNNEDQINQIVDTKENNLPTYDDVLRENSYQDDSEHLNARRRYQQHEEYYTHMDDD